MLGGTRFDEPSSIAGLVGGYGYAALGRLLLGGEGGGTVTHPGGSTARYGLMTIGYAAKTADQWQLYPYGGVGAGNLSANSPPAGGGFVTNVGLGVDVLSRSRGLGLVLGARVGYLFRFGDGHEGAAYAALTIGLGARVRHNAP
jgi:hypothetical protein